MCYCPRTLQDFVQSHSPFSPAKDALGEFGQSLESYLAGIADSKGETEEHQKNLLRDFLHQSFGYDCNTRDRIDLAIYEDSVPKVLFEVKKSDNAQEFVKPNAQNPNLECKAFYESILYFLRETLTNKNNNLTHIVLTNTEDFYIIDAKVYAAFAKDKAIVKAFKNCEHKEGNDASTKRFYEELSNLLPTLNMEIQYAHFRIDDSILASCHSESLYHSESALAGEESQRTNNKESHNILPLLYQILSPHVLLKRKTYLDANTLNQDFYDELLYILGLKENVQSGKVLILPSLAPHTLLDSICSTFELERDKDFEILFSLLTTWNNRLLFLRLLESMLLGFKHIKKPFLNLDCLKDFQALNTLFFDILAKIEENRDSNIPESLSSIPYLNSSLFEKTALEIEGKEIKLLESKPIILYHDSILYKDKNFCQSLNLNAKDKDSTLPLLEYLFAFLHAYDFTTTAQDIQNHTKINFDKLINSAVLGLVFEKLNGYKEGSFYTPSFITRYMCKQSLERVVLQKFNESQNWGCQNLEELKNKIDKLTDSKEGYKQANAIFDSIHICDPAVGSGHFLVSALNELILLKFKLGILCDENHHRIKDITLEILRDEIVIRDSQNALFTYTLPAHDNIESHKIQRALFFAKRKLIESCLFGVDINPNSCEITKLRLWIELLKYSYYKDIPNKRLETLPNIDINIKCGNSLISNIALDMTQDSLIKELKKNASKNASLEFSAEFQATANDLRNKLPKKIEEYREAVNAYKNETYADFKALQKKTIAECRDFITQLFFKLSNEYKIFKESLANYLRNYGYYGIDEGKIKGQYIEQTLQQKLNNYLIAFNFHKTLEIPKNITEYNEKELVFLITSLQNYERLIHDQSAFEWRFAFPEVLDGNGDFLGFDLVIGNPPYIQIQDLQKYVELYRKKYAQYVSDAFDICLLFIAKTLTLINKKGELGFILSDKFFKAKMGKKIREFLANKKHIHKIVSFGTNQVFERATTYVSIIFCSKEPHNDFKYKFFKLGDNFKDLTNITYQLLSTQILMQETWNFYGSNIANIIVKLENQTFKFYDVASKIAKGSSTGNDDIYLLDFVKKSGNLYLVKNKNQEILMEKNILVPYVYGENIKRLEFCKPVKYLLYPYDKKTHKLIPYRILKIKFPNAFVYLNSNKSILESRKIKTTNDNFYKFSAQRNPETFMNSKIMIPDILVAPRFGFDTIGLFHNASIHNIQLKDNFKHYEILLLGILNSKVFWFFISNTSTALRGDAYRLTPMFLEKFSFPKITKSNQKIVDRIIALVDEILAIKANCHSEGALATEESHTKPKRDVSASPQHDKISDTSKLESEIDSLVYQLYNLTDDEIKIIENKE